MCFCVSNLFTLIIHNDWCSILFSSHRGLTSSCRSRKSQDRYHYERISISVWKILEGFGLCDEFIYLPRFHEIYSKTSLLIETFTFAILTLITRWHLSQWLHTRIFGWIWDKMYQCSAPKQGICSKGEVTQISFPQGGIWICCCSVTKTCPIPCNSMDYSPSGFLVLHYLPKFAQIHVHWVSYSI